MKRFGDKKKRKKKRCSAGRLERDEERERFKRKRALPSATTHSRTRTYTCTHTHTFTTPETLNSATRMEPGKGSVAVSLVVIIPQIDDYCTFFRSGHFSFTLFVLTSHATVYCPFTFKGGLSSNADICCPGSDLFLISIIFPRK